MKQTKKDTVKLAINIIFGLMAVLSLAFTLQGFTSQGNFLQGNDDLCTWSKYNIYTNSTTSSKWFFGKCYVDVPQGYYEYDGERCGLFGISCYPTGKKETVTITKTICFRLDNGEMC